jgi:hypothetical protein
MAKQFLGGNTNGTVAAVGVFGVVLGAGAGYFTGKAVGARQAAQAILDNPFQAQRKVVEAVRADTGAAILNDVVQAAERALDGRAADLLRDMGARETLIPQHMRRPAADAGTGASPTPTVEIRA